MTTSDRRSGTERRSSERRNVSIEVEWENAGRRRPGTISDLSEDGCFVLSSGDVSPGDTVKLLLPLGDGMKAQLQGEVRNQLLEIGFALQFTEVTDAQRSVIEGLMLKHGQNT